jgi:tetratricopeptide (TPR) repeat protein
MLKDLDERAGARETAVPVGGAPRPRRRGRRWLVIGLLLIALAALVVALLVRFASFEPIAAVNEWRSQFGSQAPASGTAAGPSGNEAGRDSGGAGDVASAAPAEADDAASDEGAPGENAAEASGMSKAAATNDGSSDAGASAPVSKPVLTQLAIDRHGREIALTASVEGGAIGTEHERTTRGGAIRFTNVALGEGLTVPATRGDALGGVTLVPSDGGAVLRYRLADGARIRFSEERSGDQQRYVLSAQLPDEADQAASAPSETESTTAPEESANRDAEGNGARARPDAEARAGSANAGDEGPASLGAANEVATPSGVGGNEAAPTAGAGRSGSEAEPDGEASTAESRISRQRRGPKPGARAESAYRDALAAFEAGNNAAARDALNTALDADPGHAGARRALAMVHLRDGEPEQAAEVLREGFDRGTRTPTLIALYARSWAQRGNLDKAVAIMEQGRETVSADAQYLATLAAMYQQQGQYEAAAGAYRQALERNRARPAWWAGFGIALENSGDGPRARKAYEQALSRGGLSDSLASYVRQRLSALE